MNFKNIILGISLVLLGLSACSKETAIDELNESTSDVQIVLSSVPAITKAGMEETEKPTDAELQIQNCVLGIYDGTAKEWISTQFISSLTEDKTDTEHNKTYTVASSLKLINNHEYTIMVIANVDENNVDSYVKCNNFEDFKSIKEGIKGYAFDASKLLKYGEVNHQASFKNNKIEVPLRILAARIEFVIKVKQTDVEYEQTYYDMGNSVKLDIENTRYTPSEVKEAFDNAGIKNVVIFENWNSVPSGKPNNGELHYGDRPIDIPNGNGIKGVYIPNYRAVRIDKYMGKTIDINKVVIRNIRTQAIAVLPNQEENMFNLLEYNKERTTGKYSFYTYAKGKNTEVPLQISFSGSIQKKYILKKTAVSAEWFAFADIYEPRIWGSTSTDRFTLEPGWSGKPKVFFTLKNWKEDTSIEVPDEESSGSTLGDYSNSFIIKGEESQMIDPGHLYNVTATITDFTPVSKGQLEVSIQDYNFFEVPTFEFK